MRGADGQLRTEVRPSARPLAALFGTVTVHRLALVKHGVSGGLRPLDAQLNLPVGLYSHGVQREVAWGVAQTSFDATVQNIRRTTCVPIAKRQVEQIAVSVAQDFQAFYWEQPRRPEDDDHLLVLTFDGCGVVMLRDGLRPETRKKADKAKRRKSAAESAGGVGQPRLPDRNRKRMAAVACVYALQPVGRGKDEVLRELDRTGPRPVRPKAQNKRVWASLEQSMLQVVDDAFYEALQRDEAKKRRWVAVVDGNADQLAAIARLSYNSDVTVTIVLDLLHVLGYLWKAGKAVVGDAVGAVEAWVRERTARILSGEASVVAAGMRRQATVRKLRGKRREAVDAAANYLLNHKAYLRYHEYLRDGLPIASGVIEGACRSLVRDRMDITGARWGLPGAEAVLKLRSLRASGDLDDYLDFHARQELQRNHLDRYDEGELADLRLAA